MSCQTALELFFFFFKHLSGSCVQSGRLKHKGLFPSHFSTPQPSSSFPCGTVPFPATTEHAWVSTCLSGSVYTAQRRCAEVSPAQTAGLQ